MTDIEIKSSFIDWLPDNIENGKTAVVALTLNNIKSYECLYWTDGTNQSIMIDDEFLAIFNVQNEEELEFYDNLVEDIKSVVN